MVFHAVSVTDRDGGDTGNDNIRYSILQGSYSVCLHLFFSLCVHEAVSSRIVSGVNISFLFLVELF